MNFLAHLYLSGEDQDIQFGNFIGDLIKGTGEAHYPVQIRKGIILHREIDRYTDSHPVVAESKSRIRSEQGKFAGVVIDIFYDHFLARAWPEYHFMSLPEYASNIYAMLQGRHNELPKRGQHLLPYMIDQDWLVSYSKIEGIDRVLKGMARRTKYPSRMHEAVHVLEKEYPHLKSDFNEFFPQLANHIRLYLAKLYNE